MKKTELNFTFKSSNNGKKKETSKSSTDVQYHSCEENRGSSGEQRELDSEEKYYHAFIDTEEALKHSLDIRKFEIELYWKRATYFWTFIGVIFAGYFALWKTADAGDIPRILLFFICCLGLSFTFSWYLVNRGSKFWQNNWERHVDALEDKHIGPLYKTAIDMKSRKWRYLFSDYPYSVSKINQMLSLYLTVIWVCLLVHSIIMYFQYHNRSEGWSVYIVGGVTVIFLITVALWGKSTSNNNDTTTEDTKFITREKKIGRR